MISVIVPLYNKEECVNRAIQSVLNQTYQTFEVIVVNDGSTDQSVDIIKNINDVRIRLINQDNVGVSAARNKGISVAKYDLIAFLDADDEWKTDYLELQYGLSVKYSECDVFACNYEFKNEEGKIIPTIIRRLPFNDNDGVLINYFDVASCSHPPLWSSAVMVRKNKILDIGGFPLGVKSGEDLLTWARLAVKSKIAYTTIIGSIYYDNMDTKNVPKRIPAEVDIVGIELERLLKENPSRSLKEYVSHWYKMRSSIFMRLGLDMKAFKEAFKSLKYNPYNKHIYAYIVLLLFPFRIRKKILR